jgi:hypothetical protein
LRKTRYPQNGHLISGVIANWSAVKCWPQLMHSYTIPAGSGDGSVPSADIELNIDGIASV